MPERLPTIGGGGGGLGDMTKAVYDPTNKSGDAFLTDNFAGANLVVTGEVTAGAVSLKKHALVQTITGIFEGGVGSIATDTTKFNISDGDGVIVDAFTDASNPTVTFPAWTSAGLGDITPIYNANNITYVGIDSAGSIVQQFTEFTAMQERDLLPLLVVFSADGINVTSTTSAATQSRAPGYLASDTAKALGTINVAGNVFTAASLLTLTKSAGETFAKSINFGNSEKSPNFLISASIPTVSFIYVYDDGTGSATQVPGQTNIDPGNYDDRSGVLMSLSANKYTNLPIWFFPASGVVVVGYGQTVYNSLDQALGGIDTEIFARLAPELEDESLRAFLTVKSNASDLTVGTDAVFTQSSKFGFGAGGGGSIHHHDVAEQVFLGSTAHTAASPLDLSTLSGGGAGEYVIKTNDGSTDRWRSIYAKSGIPEFDAVVTLPQNSVAAPLPGTLNMAFTGLKIRTDEFAGEVTKEIWKVG